MILNRTGHYPETSTLGILGEQERNGEPPITSAQIWGWLASEPVAETAEERIEADRRSTTRALEVAFA